MTAGLLPATVIGGYLGAGKTTLVNHLLRNAGGLRLAVLVNEFGALPIDADLIEAQDDDIIAIAGGCICCSYGDDLTRALLDMTAMDPPPDHLLIESSGVAIPSMIVGTLGLLPGFRVDGTVIVADAETLCRTAADRYLGDTVLRQLRDADLLILNKIDLPTPRALADTCDWIAEQGLPRPVPARQCALPPEAVLGLVPSTTQPVPDPAPHAAFETLRLTPAAGCDPQALARRLTDPALGVLRAKGFVTDLRGTRHEIHIVGARADVSARATAPADGMVAIGLRGQLDTAGLNDLVTAPAPASAR
ncbi:MAG: GTP-binding protein [Rhodobacteraceae bacterium]|nr:GTP-binding protein [Paracoccaceae bacterium]